MIRLNESFATFLYFFLGTCALAALGAFVPTLTKHIGDIMQEHIAGKTILVLTGIELFIAFVCSIRNIIRPQNYGKMILYFVVNTTNFVITLAFVAAAINWGVALSSLVLFSGAVDAKVFSLLLQNALEISAIAMLLGGMAWVLHHTPANSKTAQPFSTVTKTLFWTAFIVSALFWSGFLARLISNALNT